MKQYKNNSKNININMYDRTLIKKGSAILAILICCLFCSVSLFVFSYQFVNVKITPKVAGLEMLLL